MNEGDEDHVTRVAQTRTQPWECRQHDAGMPVSTQCLGPSLAEDEVVLVTPNSVSYLP